MPLNPQLLKKVRGVGRRQTAQCPACAELGLDAKGNHLALFDGGRYACVVHPGDREHRRRIWQLAGDTRPRPLIIHPADERRLNL